MKVRIKKLPQARTGYQVKGGLVNDIPSMGGADYNAYIGQPNPSVKKTMTAVPREEANLEAEGGETVVGNIDGSGMPAKYNIKGPRHTNGGVPLNLPDDSFIFSDTKSMLIKDPTILKMFGVSSKKSYTPAELSKKYDINKYRALLQDPNSDKLTRKTAEMMIKNAVMKLGALALAQEGKKGFPQGIPVIAKPYMESMGISEEELVPQKPQQKQMAQQAPQQMPDGQPIAQPQEMSEERSEEMMAPPMAMYGMSMGGYDIPFYNDPNEMAYGGIVKYQTAGEVVKGKTGDVNASKVDKLPGTGTKTKTSGGKDAEIVYEAGSQRQAAKKAKSGSGNGTFNKKAWEGSICDMIKAGATYEELTIPSEKNGFKTHMAPGASSKAIFDRCNTADVQEKFAEKETAVYVDPVTVVDEETGETIQKCYCPDENGNEVEVPMIDGKCECENYEDMSMGDMMQQPQENLEGWYPQDVNNLYGALGTMWSRRKGQPWSPRVDLEEPRPTFLDPTRELAAQSEQANIASNAVAQFAGPQALNARLSAIQGQGASQAANTLSNINNQNVNIANQFEGQQVGIRNQEQAMNQQLADRLYDETELANQNFANTRLADKMNTLQMYNTGITNEANRMNLNDMYPDYAINRKGRLTARPTMKKADPTAESEDALEYALQLKGSGLSDKVQTELLNKKFPKAKKGGQTKKAGYVYADMMYPFIF
jgi:hypothetical protein